MTDNYPDDVLVERRGAASVITINRAAQLNTVNYHVGELIGQALADADSDPTVRAIIITGSGTRAFSAGADLKAIASGEPVQESLAKPDSFARYVGYRGGLPTIAAVNGLAYGGGMEIVLASDLVIAADHATFALPEAKRGFIAGGGGAMRLGRRIPPIVAMEMLLTGEPITAQRAFEVSLVNRVVPIENLLDAALALAERIAANAPMAVRAHKRLVLDRGHDGNSPDETRGWARTLEEMNEVMGSADAVEGPRAFVEKRPPRWLGR
ncbi:MAG: putative enoyl-CoA hydratase [Microbacteriaceae bacterium]|nr:putative enoyl-CoA hydratase [Microbacteriaceae bacterium]